MAKKQAKKAVVAPNVLPPPECPKGYYRNSQGVCVQDPG